MQVKVDNKTLFRSEATETQTNKSRYERWENVVAIFKLKDTKSLENKHLLLVDDVITTGATLEACAQTLFQIKNIKISIAAIAYANN
jgi:predicted amidophosphoribosyltransferase